MDEVLADLKEDVEMALCFVSVLKTKVESVYNALHPMGEGDGIREELTRKLEVIDTIASKRVKMTKVTEYRFLTDNE